MNKKTFLAVLTLILAGSALRADVTITPKVRKFKSYTNTIFTIKGAGPYTQQFIINEFTKKEGKTLANNLGNVLGMGQGWFANGMMMATLNGKIRLLDQPYKFTRRKDGFTVNTLYADCPVEVKFTYFPGKDHVLCTFDAKSKTPVKKLELRLLATPGHGGISPEGRKPFKRHIETAARSWALKQGAPAVKLDLKKENYATAFDDYNDVRGAAVIVFDPAEFASAEAGLWGRDLVCFTFRLAPGKTRCSFLLRGVPENHLDTDEVREEMKKTAPKLLEELKKIKLK